MSNQPLQGQSQMPASLPYLVVGRRPGLLDRLLGRYSCQNEESTCTMLLQNVLADKANDVTLESLRYGNVKAKHIVTATVDSKEEMEAYCEKLGAEINFKLALERSKNEGHFPQMVIPVAQSP